MRSVILLLGAASLVYATTALEIKKGWQLIGVPTSLEVDKSFNNKNVEIVWGFNAQAQNWSGFSPDENRSTVISQSYSELANTKPYEAVWVFSNDNWILNYDEQESTSEAKNSTISLQTGWNLVTLPQKIVVSDAFFEDALVWRYSQNSEWSVNNSSLAFPQLEDIKQSEGIWVKSDVAKTIDVDQESSKLSIFTSKDKMLAYISNMIKMNQYRFNDYFALETNLSVDEVSTVSLDDAISSTVATPTVANDVVSESIEDGASSITTAEKSSTDATTTNLQDEGVDEGDILKHDGTHIFSVDNTNAKIIVTSFENITAKNYIPITTLDFTNKNVVAMYLQNSRLSVISRVNNYAKNDDIFEGKPVEEVQVAEVVDAKKSIFYSNYKQTLALDVFDISDIANIKSIAQHTIDGNYHDSRLVNGNLYLISKFNPQVEYEYPKVYENTVCSTLDRNEIYYSCGISTTSSEPLSEPTKIDFATQECTEGKDYTAWNKNSCYQYSYDGQGAWKYDYENPIVVSETLIPTISSDGVITI